MSVLNEPNAAKLLSSLRNSGYDSYTAILDIIDNSIDARAKEIAVFVNEVQGVLRIIVSDDGYGMSKEVLDEALKLGSETQKDEHSDLGKYGMGLCTASISMAKKLSVITKKETDDYYYSSQDLDEVSLLNKFVKELREANESEIQFFDDYLDKNHGTVVILEKIDRITNTNPSIFSSTLSKKIAQIYRKFIAAGINFYVNEKKIDLIDPLMTNDSRTQIYSNETYELPNSNEKISVKIVILPDLNESLEKEYKLNIASQGFYILRNQREIASGKTLDIFKKHNDFNRLRMELSFSSTLDNEMVVRFTKEGISPNQVIKDFLRTEIGGQINSIRKMMLQTKMADKSKEIDHSQSAENIARKAKLLITPDFEIEKREQRVNSDQKRTYNEASSNRVRVPGKTHLSPHGLGARFETVSMGKQGLVYECEQQGKVIIIRWNVDHPFYEKVLLANKEKKNLTADIDYLVYAFASAELKSTNDDNVELLNSIKTIMSANLRALLS